MEPKVLIPARDGWCCHKCTLLGRDVDATVILQEGIPGALYSGETGLCGNHAETLDVPYVDFVDSEEEE